jgi:hypothetical protein
MDVSVFSQLQQVMATEIKNAHTLSPLWRRWKVCFSGQNPDFNLAPWAELVHVDNIRVELQGALEDRLNYRVEHFGHLSDAHGDDHVDLFAVEGALPVFSGTGITADIISRHSRVNVKLKRGDEVWMMPEPSLTWIALTVVEAGEDPLAVLTTQELQEALGVFQAKRVKSVCVCMCVCVCVCVCVRERAHMEYIMFRT